MINPIRTLLQRSNTAIMGVVNVTPDSFSDGGQFANSEDAFLHALDLVEQGADIIDIGGESTRPGAQVVSVQQELDRVVPIIERLHGAIDTSLSIDTHKAQIMTNAVRAGASLINDVNGLRSPGALQAAAQARVPVCIMHMLGSPETMQEQPEYQDVVAQVKAFFVERLESCQEVGIKREDVILDPGIGFGKTLEHNLSLLNALPRLRIELDLEFLIAVSRKSMINDLLGREVTERLSASLGLAVQAVINGAKIIRVHDVRATYDAVRSIEAVMNVNNSLD